MLSSTFSEKSPKSSASDWLIPAASWAAVEMAKRLSEGKEIGSMFITDPQMDDYQLYAAARRAREAQELEGAGEG